MTKIDPALRKLLTHRLKRRAQQKAALKKVFSRTLKKGQRSDLLRLEKLEALLVAFYDAFIDTDAGYATNFATSCDHERWAYFKTEYAFELSHLGAAAITTMIRQDDGKCRFCGGNAHKCYYRHAEGRSCA